MIVRFVWTRRSRRCSSRESLAVKLALCAVLATPACGAEGPLSVHQVQGPGGPSPYRDRDVELRETVVTAVGPHGFFVQTPAGCEDGDPRTPEGLYVYTAGAPAVQAADRVRLSGRVIEFHGHTQLADAEWLRAGRGPVPDPVALAGPPAHGWESLESLRVAVDGGLVVEPTDRHGNARIVASGARPFRRPGTGGSGERVLRLDPEGLGGDARHLHGGARIRATGPLVFRHGEHTLWPERLAVLSEPDLPGAARRPQEGELTVATFNLRLFHDEHAAKEEPVVSPALFRARLRKLSGWLEQLLHCPDVVAVQEIEDVEVLGRLAAAADCDYRAVAGERRRGPGLGYLVSLADAKVRELGVGAKLSVDGSALFDRPPLMLRIAAPGSEPLVMINVHLRSLIDIDAERVQRKRLEQAEALRLLVEGAMVETGGRVIVLGDFNAFEFSDGVVDVLARLTGARPVRDAFPAPRSRDALLDNRAAELPDAERYSYIHRGVAQLLDHVLTGHALRDSVTGTVAVRGNADAPFPLRHEADTLLRASDHDPVILYLTP